MQPAQPKPIPEDMYAAFAARAAALVPIDRVRLGRRLADLRQGIRVTDTPRASGPQRGHPGASNRHGQRTPRKGPPHRQHLSPDQMPRALEEFESVLLRAEALVRERAETKLRFVYPQDLPISQKREEISRAIRDHQVVVLCGETGSGKTTQIPKICLELGRGRLGTIGHTQPRRIAARTVAARIAEEMDVALGSAVGYKVRFGDKTSATTLVKVMTDGVLLAETQRDRNLQQYDTIIIDEAHERSLNIDFMLGYLKTLLPRRPDLKVIVTSATIDPERFARHFASHAELGKPVTPAPIITVSGRTYPVEVRYRPPADKDAAEHEDDLQDEIVRAVEELRHEGPGDVLVFLSGEREIRETAGTLQEHRFDGEKQPEILPLYARLSVEEQQRVFQPHDRRRVVLATNVAETSLTVPGIRYVIDAGNARMSRYSPRTKVQRLEIEPISKASADQRKGRCGRLGPGVCIRLYEEADFTKRPEFTEPEIVRANLASVILQMESLHLGKVEEFPFLEAPDPRAIRDGYDTLLELGAVDEENKLTPLGTELARLPIDPRVGRMILEGRREKCLPEVLILAAALSVQDPRERPLAKQQDADAAHEATREPTSDFLSYIKLWGLWQESRTTLGGSRLRKWCKERFLSFVRMREWEDVHNQLRETLEEMRATPMHDRAPMRGNIGNARAPNTPTNLDALPLQDRVHRAVLTGLLCNIGNKLDTDDAQPGEYQGGRSVRFFLFPGSALFRTRPPWVMSAEIVRTTKVYARTAAPIRPEWVEELGAHLCKRVYSDPRWDRATGRAVASEKVLIFGIELVGKRKADYSNIDPVASRQIFIQHGLVAGEVLGRFPFLLHNERLRERVVELEAKARRGNLLADEEKRFRYFDAKVPQDICTTAVFEKWFQQQNAAALGAPIQHRLPAAPKPEPSRLLCMNLPDMLADGAMLPDPELFPDEIDVGSVKLPLQHVFDQASDTDGVTVVAPIEALGQLSAERFAWLIPGHVREKIEAILRGLGKDFRRVLPPANQLAETCASGLPFAKGNFFDALRERIRKATTIDIPKDALAGVPLPLWMSTRFEIVEHDGATVAVGRDLNQLKALLAPKIKQGLLTSPSRFTRDNITTWDFGDLPERVELERGGVVVAAFPGIIDNRSSVALRIFNSFEASQLATRAGSRRLFMREARDALSRHAAYIPGVERMALQFAPLGTSEVFRDSVQCLVADRAFIGDMLPVRTEKEFAFRTTRGIERLGPAVQEVQPVLASVLSTYQALQAQVAASNTQAFATAVNEVRDQLRALMPGDFMILTPFEWLRHFPRYLQAMQLRVQKLAGGGVPRDARLMQDVTPLQRAYDDLAKREQELGLNPAKIAQFRWLLQEFRVQVFAQELRTSVPVSAKRLQELWQDIVRG